jgi:hypothetical protein
VLMSLRGDGDIASRLRTATRLTWPLYALLGPYFVLRWLALGRLVGGYGEMQFAPVAMASGLCQITADLLVPMRWSGSETLAAQLGVPRAALSWTAALPVLIAVAIALWQPRRLFALLMFVLACLPMAAFFASAHNVHNLRYYYLPTAALVGLLAAPGRLVTALVLATWLLPLASVRLEVIEADLQSRAMHAGLQQAADGGARAPMFVAGLPHANASGHSLQFHFGVDRVLQPPFRNPGVALFALRPITEGPGVFRLDPPDREPTELSPGSTWWWHDSAGLQPARQPSALPDLPIEGDRDGVLDLTSPRLRRLERHDERIVLTTHAGRPMAFRLTIFTACGYFCCLFADHGPTDADHGTIDLRQFFVGVPDYPEPLTIQPAIYAPGEAYVMRGLELPTTHDLVPEFPVLLESGAIDAGGFVASHRARRLLTFRFDRGYTRWVHRALNLEH